MNSFFNIKPEFLKENFSNPPIFKTVFVEKTSFKKNELLSSLHFSGDWDGIHYIDNNIALISKSSSGQLVLVGYTTRESQKSKDNFVPLSLLMNDTILLSIVLFLDVNITSETVGFNRQNVMNMHIFALSWFYKILPKFRERMSKFNKGNLSHNGVNKFMSYTRSNFKNELQYFKAVLIKAEDNKYIC